MNTLSAAKASRRFYGRSGFKKINAEDLPVKYVFNDDVSGLMKRALCRTAIKRIILTGIEKPKGIFLSALIVFAE